VKITCFSAQTAVQFSVESYQRLTKC